MLLTTLPWCDPANNLGPIRYHLFCVKTSFLTGKSLYDDPRMLINKYAHFSILSLNYKYFFIRHMHEKALTRIFLLVHLNINPVNFCLGYFLLVKHLFLFQTVDCLA